MSTTDLSHEQITAVLRALEDPIRMEAVRSEEARRKLTEAAEQRDMALIRLDQAYSRQSLAQSELQSASEKLLAARKEAESLNPAVLEADAKLRQSTAEVHAAHRALQDLGGSWIALGLQRLFNELNFTQEKLKFLEASKFHEIMSTDGTRPVWRTLRPEIDVQIAPLKNLIQRLQSAYDDLQKLDRARGNSPESIRRQVLAMMKEFALPLDDIDPSAKPVA